MKLLIILFAMLAVVAMVSANNNPMCTDAAQSGGGYKVYEMSAQARAAAARSAEAPRVNYNYGSSRTLNRNA